MKQHWMTCAGWMSVVVAGTPLEAAVAPPVLAAESVAGPAGPAAFTLRAWPGEYVIQAVSALPGEWSNSVRVSVGREGVARGAAPMDASGRMFLRAAGATPLDGAGCAAQFLTLGAVFEPEARCDGEAPGEFAWLWSDGAASTNRPVARKDFGSASARAQGLKVFPSRALTSLNLGFDGADGGNVGLMTPRPAQNVAAAWFPYPLPGLRYWASSYNPITNTLDFRGFDSLEVIECFQCSTLRSVVATNLPALRRACFEDCDLRELDLSGNPNLEDLRGALNAYTNIVAGRGTGPKVWHWCVRDNPQLRQRFSDLMTNFFSLAELYIWNDNQTGEFRTGSTNLSDLLAANNHFTSAWLPGQSRLWRCELQDNAITNINLDACRALQYLNLRNNALDTPALDALLAELERSALALVRADLTGNSGVVSAAGRAHYTNLALRGAEVLLDWPAVSDGSNNIPGGASAVTFVTTSRQPRMEIQTQAGVATSIVWHWGDGTSVTGARTASHEFASTGLWTNYVEVAPPGCVTYFGAESGATGQGIRAVFGLTNFPSLDFLFLYQESVRELSVAGCSNLRQLHLAANPVSAEVCDQWFLDLDAAVPGPVTGADFFYPSAARTSRSDAAWSSLSAKGYSMHPY